MLDGMMGWRITVKSVFMIYWSSMEPAHHPNFGGWRA